MTRWHVLAAIALALLSGCSAASTQYQYQNQTFPQSEEGVVEKQYLNIGADPVDPKRAMKKGERLFTLESDVLVVTQARSGKISYGWLHAGEQVFAVRASDLRYWEAIVIKRCGNPILNREYEGVPPIWIVDSVQPVKLASSYAPVAVAATPPQTSCKERKKGWGSWVGGTFGLIVGLFTHNPWLASGLSAGGSLIGSYADGGCIETKEVFIAGGFAVAGYHLTQPRKLSPRNNPSGSPSNGGGPNGFPGNNTPGPGGIPGN